MTTVDGIAAAIVYAEGYSDGEITGNFAMSEGLGTMSDAITEARHEAASGTRVYRAYWLGYARGYRTATRTFKYGKWGS